MSWFVPTVKVTVRRVLTDGEPGVVVATGVPCTNGNRELGDSESVTGGMQWLFRPGTDIQRHDVLTDEATGYTYKVFQVLNPTASLIGPPDVRVYSDFAIYSV